MGENAKPLSRVVIETATPRIPASVSLTPAEQRMLAEEVERELRTVVESLTPDEDRSSLELSKDIVKGIKARINLDTYKSNPVKRRRAISEVNSLLRDWEWFIRRSEGFALLEQSTQALHQEAGLRSHM